MVADNAIATAPDSLPALRRTVLQVLSTIPAPHTPVVMDRLPVDDGGQLTQQAAHKGVVLSFPASTARDDDRARDLVRVNEELRITGMWRIKPKDQGTSLDDAWAWEEIVASTIRNAALLRRFAPLYRGSVRATAANSNEWWVFTMTFQLTREIR